MHIPENYISPETCAVMAAAMVPVWIHAVRKIKTEMPKDKMPMLGVGAAFSFLIMMFNVPLPGGTTGHAVGGTLIALLFGPDAACIAVSVALLIQAVIFGDGGILSFGANCFNMAFLLPYVGFGIYRLFTHKSGKPALHYAGAAAGSYVGLNVAAFFAALEFGIQPLLFKDAAGNALYCPYGLSVSVPAMMSSHLLIAGFIEAAFTVAVFAFIRKTSPDLTYSEIREANPSASQKKHIPVFALIAVLIGAVPLGLLATGTAWGEWSAEEITEKLNLGYTPSGISDGWSLNAILPDYSFSGMNEVLGYIFSAILGTALLIIIFKLISIPAKKRTK